MKATNVLTEARRHLGMIGRPNPPSRWYAKRHGNIYLEAAWCDMFVSWVAEQLGFLKEIGEYAYTPSHVNFFKKKGQWGKRPKIGAIVFFDWNKDGVVDHVGFVEAIRSDGSVYTIEGNTSNAVRRRLRYPSDIYGYGYPEYEKVPAYPGKIIYPGDSGDHVRNVKERLKVLGYKNVTSGPSYKGRAVDAVKDFQKKNRLEVDGRVGPITWGALFG